MDRHIRGIDHLLVGVRELEAAAAAWRRLGFTTTPIGRHVGWTTANVCVMLERGYIELLGVLDPSRVRHDIAAFLEQHGEGGMGLALATDDATATAAAWERTGIAVSGPEALARRLEGSGETIELMFANVTPSAPELEGFVFFACFHKTPQALRQPAWLKHENGAIGLKSCTILADPPGAVATAFARLLGEDTAVNTDHVTTFHLGRQSLVVAPLEDVRLFFPTLGEPAATPRPRLVAATLEVADLEASEAFFEARQIPFTKVHGGLLLDPSLSHGLALELVAATPPDQLAS